MWLKSKHNEFNIIIITNILIVLLQLISEVNGRVKRCYVCRSRGLLGDCKDSFEFNTTTVDGQSSVEAQPCASGWCGKSIEGEDDGQHVMATERMCLQRPPSDHKERCAQTFYGNKKKSFFMCFCKGDLCNHAFHSSIHSYFTTFLFLIISFIF